MYRTSQIYKVQSKGGSYKTKGKYYSFSRNDGLIIVFTIKQGKYGLPELGKYWELEALITKKYFKMIGSAVDPIKLKKIFEKEKFFNRVDKTKETINLFPTRQTIIRNKIDREIEEMKKK